MIDIYFIINQVLIIYKILLENEMSSYILLSLIFDGIYAIHHYHICYLIIHLFVGLSAI
jgi:hypothetical protein